MHFLDGPYFSVKLRIIESRLLFLSLSSIKMIFADWNPSCLVKIKGRKYSLIRIAFAYSIPAIIHTQSSVVRVIAESIFSISKVDLLFLSSTSQYAVWNFGDNSSSEGLLNNSEEDDNRFCCSSILLCSFSLNFLFKFLNDNSEPPYTLFCCCCCCCCCCWR